MSKASIANIVLPSTPSDRQKIKNAIIEGANSMVRIDAEKDAIKAICDSLKEDYELPPAIVKQMINVYHKQNLTEVANKTETLVDMYEELIGGQTQTP